MAGPGYNLRFVKFMKHGTCIEAHMNFEGCLIVSEEQLADVEFGKQTKHSGWMDVRAPEQRYALAESLDHVVENQPVRLICKIESIDFLCKQGTQSRRICFSRCSRCKRTACVCQRGVVGSQEPEPALRMKLRDCSGRLAWVTAVADSVAGLFVSQVDWQACLDAQQSATFADPLRWVEFCHQKVECHLAPSCEVILVQKPPGDGSAQEASA